MLVMSRAVLVLLVDVAEQIQGSVHSTGQALQRPPRLPASPSGLDGLADGREEADVEDVGKHQQKGRHGEGVEEVTYHGLVLSQLLQLYL